MKINETLRGRRALFKVAGGLEYLFFTSILVSAIALAGVCTLFVDGVFKTEQVRSAYVALFSSAAQSASALYLPSMPDYLENALNTFYEIMRVAFENAPSTLAFFICMLFAVCPVYQGTVRYSAYLIEEQKPLRLTAVLYYFTSPRLYFSSVLLTLRLGARKLLAALLFFLPPTVFFSLGSALSSTYFGQQEIAAAIMIMSAVLLLLSGVLYFVFCKRYFAVRYLYALGGRKKIFKSSARLTMGKRATLFLVSLRLSLNFIPALFILPAPAALSRSIFGRGLVTRALIREKAERKPAV